MTLSQTCCRRPRRWLIEVCLFDENKCVSSCCYWACMSHVCYQSVIVLDFLRVARGDSRIFTRLSVQCDGAGGGATAMGQDP